jgi:citrate synthase
MAALQTCVSAIGLAATPRDNSHGARRALALEYIGRFPSLIAAFHRVRSGLDVVEPDTTLGRAADFLRMLTGEAPDATSAATLETALILHADHTMNASTFAARVVASTESAPSAAIAAAVGSLGGPLHGGANERVLRMLEEIGSPENVEPWLERKLANKEKIMGMGHRIYKTKDPRANILQELAKRLTAQAGGSPLYATAVELERVAAARLAARGICPNVDFYSGIVYHELGIPTDLFTPIFALARIAGWMAHWLEQMRSNRLFRPTQVYTGVRGVAFQRLSER